MKKIIFPLLVLSLLSSCTRGFEEMNTDRDNFTENTITAKLLLPTILYQFADYQVSNNFDLGMRVSQQMAYLLYNQTDRYNWTATDAYWRFYGQLQNLNDLDAIGVRTTKPQYQGISKILKAFMFTQISDAYGSVPMSEAGKNAQGILTPKYDSQEEVYKQSNELLKEANNLLKNTSGVDGDKLYGGDTQKWRKFANSLRLRILLKMMNKANVAAEIAQIYSNASEYPIFQSNSDAAVYNYSGVGNDVSPLSFGRGRMYEMEQLAGLPTTMLNMATKYGNDPRIDTWYAKPKNAPNGSHVATTPGLQNSSYADVSMLNPAFYTNATFIKGIMMNYSELQFILAELSEKGVISGSAKTHYENGVKASFDFWKTTMPANYLTTTAAYSEANPTLIAEQKWLANFWNGFEAWNDFKRTKLPVLKPAESNNNENKIPNRLIYPSIEQSVNPENYSKAAQQIGGDNINSKMWWQK